MSNIENVRALKTTDSGYRKAWWIKGLASKPDDQSLIPGTYLMGRGQTSYGCSLAFIGSLCTFSHVQTKYNI